MSKRAAVTAAEIKRTIKAAEECGLTVAECVMTPSEVRFIFGPSVRTTIRREEGPRPKAWK